MKRNVALLAAAVIFAAATAGAQAGYIITTFDKVTSVNIGGTDYNVWDMMVEVDPDWTTTEMNLTLTSGEIYQETVGGSNTEPNPAFFASFPDLEWDTYAATPGGHARSASFAGTTVMDATTFDAVWFDSVTGEAGTFRIARITLSTDADGDITGDAFFAIPGETEPGKESLDDYYVENGNILPEPATLAIIGLGGICVLLRRRR